MNEDAMIFDCDCFGVSGYFNTFFRLKKTFQKMLVVCN